MKGLELLALSMLGWYIFVRKRTCFEERKRMKYQNAFYNNKTETAQDRAGFSKDYMHQQGYMLSPSKVLTNFIVQDKMRMMYQNAV